MLSAVILAQHTKENFIVSDQIASSQTSLAGTLNSPLPFGPTQTISVQQTLQRRSSHVSTRT